MRDKIDEWLRRANGWQRIWVILVGVSLLGHIGVLALMLGDLTGRTTARDLARSDLGAAKAYLNKFGRECTSADQELQQAREKYRGQRSDNLRENRAQKAALAAQRQELQHALDLAEGRLDTYRALQLENQIRVVQRHIRELDERATNYPTLENSGLLPTWAAYRDKECRDKFSQMESAQERLRTTQATVDAMPWDAAKAIFLVVLSWVASAGLVYAVGWLAGWVFRGFKRTGN